MGHGSRGSLFYFGFAFIYSLCFTRTFLHILPFFSLSVLPKIKITPSPSLEYIFIYVYKYWLLCFFFVRVLLVGFGKSRFALYSYFCYTARKMDWCTPHIEEWYDQYLNSEVILFIRSRGPPSGSSPCKALMYGLRIVQIFRDIQ